MRWSYPLIKRSTEELSQVRVPISFAFTANFRVSENLAGFNVKSHAARARIYLAHTFQLIVVSFLVDASAFLAKQPPSRVPVLLFSGATMGNEAFLFCFAEFCDSHLNRIQRRRWCQLFATKMPQQICQLHTNRMRGRETEDRQELVRYHIKALVRENTRCDAFWSCPMQVTANR